jgi:hypothetical protein
MRDSFEICTSPALASQKQYPLAATTEWWKPDLR